MPELTSRQAHRAAEEIFRLPDLQSRVVAARTTVLLLLVGPWLWTCYRLSARVAEILGAESARWNGALLVALLGLSLSVVPYLTILQTDVAVALAFALTVMACLDYQQRPGWRTSLGMGAALGLGLASKFSSVILIPTVLLSWGVVLVGSRRRDPTGTRRSWLELAIVGLTLLTVVHGVYWVANRNYESESGRDAISAYCRGEGTVIVEDRLERWEAPLLALEQVDPYLAQWLVGFLGVQAQNSIGVYTSYAFGEVRSQGRWWYFPVVLLVKTPLVLIALFLWLLWRRDGPVRIILKRPELAPIAVTTSLYLGLALLSNYNLGIRHLLPIMPFLFLPLALFLAEGRPRLAFSVISLLALESLLLAPLWMSATNTWFLGSHNPTRLALGDGNLEYRQNFGELARWADERRIVGLAVLYPTLAPEVLAAYLPTARLVGQGDAVEPGWYAVNATVEQLVPAILRADPALLRDAGNLQAAASSWRPVWRRIAAGEDRGWAAGTFHIYRVD
jgi:4-amino-4-deoxy-L-arabinose transferase-like glycosyltransferase